MLMITNYFADENGRDVVIVCNFPGDNLPYAAVTLNTESDELEHYPHLTNAALKRLVDEWNAAVFDEQPGNFTHQQFVELLGVRAASVVMES